MKVLRGIEVGLMTVIIAYVLYKWSTFRGKCPGEMSRYRKVQGWKSVFAITIITSDSCALQEALYKCVDTIQYNLPQKAKEQPHLGMLLAKRVQPKKSQFLRKPHSQTKRSKMKDTHIKNLFLTAVNKLFYEEHDVCPYSRTSPSLWRP